MIGSADAMAPKSRSYQISATPVIVFGHLLFIAVTTLVLVWLLKFREGLAFESANKFKIFNLHPLLMVIGFILMAGEAIMAYKSTPSRRDIQVQKAVHLTLQTIALGCGIFGIVVIFKFHNETNMPDMVTLHSWLVFARILLVCVPRCRIIFKSSLSAMAHFWWLTYLLLSNMHS
ncbi:hypothetical protein V6Z12_D02G162000 [Gossypium hirsutum]